MQWRQRRISSSSRATVGGGQRDGGPWMAHLPVDWVIGLLGVFLGLRAAAGHALRPYEGHDVHIVVRTDEGKA